MSPLGVLANVFDALGSPVDWLLVHLQSGFAAVGPARAIGAFGLAIITTTLLIRAALFPIFGWQLRTMSRTQAEQRTIAPQQKQLRQRYRKDPKRLSQELQKLYREHGISPFSGCLGCLPLLIQLPVLFALYNGIRLATGHLHTDLGFLWVGDVSRTLQEACCHSSGLGGLFLRPQLAIIPGLATLATYVQAKMMTPPVHAGMSDAERKQADVSKMMVLLGPVMVLLFSYSFYQGITLYWLTQSIFMIGQQYYVRGWGSLAVPSWVPGADRTTPLSFPRGEAAVARPPRSPAARDGRASSGAARRARPGRSEGSDGAPPRGAAPAERPLSGAGVSRRGGSRRRRRR